MRKAKHLKLVETLEEESLGEEISRSTISDELSEWLSAFGTIKEAAIGIGLSGSWFRTLQSGKINPKTGRPYQPGPKACRLMGLERSIHFHRVQGEKSLAETIASWQKKKVGGK